MTDSKQRLREIRKSCDLGPLKSVEALDKYWIDTDNARDALHSVRESLRELLQDREDVKILFCGHGGTGKSTELNKLVQELDGAYLVVGFSILQEMNPVDVNGEDLILVLMERLVAVAVAKEKDLSVDSVALQGVYDYFATYTETRHETDARAGSLAAGAKASTPSLLAGLLSLFVDFKAEVRYEARNETNRISKIRKRPGDLINYANLLVNAVRQSLPINQRLLFIVEDLDKLDIAVAREVFIEKPTILTSLNVSIIYTIPIFTFHSPDASLLQRQFHHTFTLPMIKTIGADGKKAEGFDVVGDILVRRLGSDALTPDGLNLLIEKTGGVLQHAFEVIVTASLFRRAAVPLEKELIKQSLQRKKAEMRTEISLPYDPVPGLERPEQLYDRLNQCLTQQQIGKPCQPSGLVIDQVLLKSCALVEYNGERWLGVHPLVQEILAETNTA